MDLLGKMVCVRHTNFAATLRQGGYYIRGGLLAKGGLMPVDTVVLTQSLSAFFNSTYS
jgi:hypothetical protein